MDLLKLPQQSSVSVEKLKKRYKSKSEVSRDDKAARRALAPFLKRYKKRELIGLAEVKEEFRNVYMQTRPAEVLAKLDAFFTDSLELHTVLNETSEILKVATRSLGVSVYLVDEATNHITLNPKYIPRDPRQIVRYSVGKWPIFHFFGFLIFLFY